MKKQAKGPKFRAPRFRVGQVLRSSSGDYVHVHSFYRDGEQIIYRVEGDPREPEVDERFLRPLSVCEAGPARGRKR